MPKKISKSSSGTVSHPIKLAAISREANASQHRIGPKYESLDDFSLFFERSVFIYLHQSIKVGHVKLETHRNKELCTKRQVQSLKVSEKK